MSWPSAADKACGRHPVPALSSNKRPSRRREGKSGEKRGEGRVEGARRMRREKRKGRITDDRGEARRRRRRIEERRAEENTAAVSELRVLPFSNGYFCPTCVW